MPNITLTVPAEVLRAAKIRAAEQGTSVSGLVRDFLTSLSANDGGFERYKREQQEFWARIDADPTYTFSAADRLTREELYDPDRRREERELLRQQREATGRQGG